MLSNGRFCVLADKGVFWRTLEPFPNTVQLTRDEIVHLQGDRVAMRLDAKQEPAVRMINRHVVCLISRRFGKLKNCSKSMARLRQYWKVTLKAREPGLARAISSIVLDGGAYVKNITISEASGDRTSIVFSEIQTGEAAMSVDEAALF